MDPSSIPPPSNINGTSLRQSTVRAASAEGFHNAKVSNNGHSRRKLILCFDGTGNKFKGNSGDTNILNIFRMLDRSGGDQFHYYQPGIGTYITNGTLSRTHMGSRMKSWVNKAMDAAVGTSFDQHVIGGYKFLMRYYSPGDDIYMFGFSRGAYTARFLAEMLDHVGLVSQGNEEMVMFAWKTFSEWQRRQSNERKEHMYNYMKAFRETFARPVRRVRFLGLFDTVNSVPQFESAWLKRSRGFPYTARSTARIVRHAVGIDERRAKFRQDLVEKVDITEIARHRSWKIERQARKASKKLNLKLPSTASITSRRSSSILSKSSSNKSTPLAESSRTDSRPSTLARAPPLEHAERFSPGGHPGNLSVSGSNRKSSGDSVLSFLANEQDSDPGYDGDFREQDIEEVWFPGAHGDIGGGWDLPNDELPLSHGPLLWMVREARKAGVMFDKKRMQEQNCWLEEFSTPPLDPISHTHSTGASPPPTATNSTTSSTSDFAVRHFSPPESTPPTTPRMVHFPAEDPLAKDATANDNTVEYLYRCYTKGKIHDCLLFNNGLGPFAVLGWKMMEYLPFRRMDLQPDGSWKAIVWPLPRGEVRDIPEGVRVHCSVVERMKADPKYRPGNLLVGGGGRGVRKAPEHVGMGEWIAVHDEGNLVGEVLTKKSAWEQKRRRQGLAQPADVKGR